MERNQIINGLKFLVFLIIFYAFSQLYYTRNFNFTDDLELIIGEASNLPATWVGTKDVDKNLSLIHI